MHRLQHKTQTTKQDINYTYNTDNNEYKKKQNNYILSFDILMFNFLTFNRLSIK